MGQSPIRHSKAYASQLVVQRVLNYLQNHRANLGTRSGSLAPDLAAFNALLSMVHP